MKQSPVDISTPAVGRLPKSARALGIGLLAAALVTGYAIWFLHTEDELTVGFCWYSPLLQRLLLPERVRSVM